MKSIYAFIAGNSRVTPIGVLLAVAAGSILHIRPAVAGVTYLGILILTLVASSFERPS